MMKTKSKGIKLICMGLFAVYIIASCKKSKEEPTQPDKTVTVTASGFDLSPRGLILTDAGTSFYENGVKIKVSLTSASSAEANADVSILHTDIVTDETVIIPTDFPEYLLMKKAKSPNTLTVTFKDNATAADKHGFKKVTLNFDETTQFSFDANSEASVAAYKTNRAKLKADVQNVASQVNTKSLYVRIWE